MVKESWSCCGHKAECDLAGVHAAAKGRYTLAIDRLGTGSSSRPDDVFGVVQAPPRDGASSSKSSTPSATGRRSTCTALRAAPQFDRIVLVGHSYGAGLGVAMALHYPRRHRRPGSRRVPGLKPTLPGRILKMHASCCGSVRGLQATIREAACRFITAATQESSTSALFSGAYDPEVARLDWEFGTP